MFKLSKKRSQDASVEAYIIGFCTCGIEICSCSCTCPCSCKPAISQSNFTSLYSNPQQSSYSNIVDSGMADQITKAGI